MKMIQDLGMIQNKNKRERYAIYECTQCKEPFRKRCSDVKYFNTQKCPKCNRGKHKQSKTRIYHIWGNMKKRCNNKEYCRFKEWGGRGIKLCKEWEDFANFYKWANENGYSDELTIDRKDNDKDYEPNNCRWVKLNIQARNTRLLSSANSSGYRGVSFDKKINKFRARVTVDCKVISIGYFKNAKDASIARDKYVIDNNLEHTLNNPSLKEKYLRSKRIEND